MPRYNRFSRKRALPMTLLKRAKKQIATSRKQQLQAFFPALFVCHFARVIVRFTFPRHKLFRMHASLSCALHQSQN